MDKHLISYFIGILIVLVSHVYSLVTLNPFKITMQQHSYGNLLAVALIAYYFMNKERYISF